MSDKTEINVQKLTAKDFQSSQPVKWCPGCGDYSILAQVTKLFPKLNIPKENFVWVSGIGCSSRFPYYMDTYGFHGIHGRAAAIASGIKVANPALSVWVATGDGDLLSIGGNHFIHACRRNIDLKVLLFNNKIYGLTKGQYSPTSDKGKKTKSSPFGSVDYPFNPISLALGSGVTFAARVLDKDQKTMNAVLEKAAAHNGTAFVEVLLRCAIFDDISYDKMANKETRADNVLVLEHDKPMTFGKDNEKGIILDGFTPRIVELKNGKYSADDLWIHDENDKNKSRAMILAGFSDMDGFPTPVGVYRKEDKPTYEFEVEEQIDKLKKGKTEYTFEEVIGGSANTWVID